MTMLITFHGEVPVTHNTITLFSITKLARVVVELHCLHERLTMINESNSCPVNANGANN